MRSPCDSGCASILADAAPPPGEATPRKFRQLDAGGRRNRHERHRVRTISRPMPSGFSSSKEFPKTYLRFRAFRALKVGFSPSRFWFLSPLPQVVGSSGTSGTSAPPRRRSWAPRRRWASKRREVSRMGPGQWRHRWLDQAVALLLLLFCCLIVFLFSSRFFFFFFFFSFFFGGGIPKSHLPFSCHQWLACEATGGPGADFFLGGGKLQAKPLRAFNIW